MFSQQQDNMKVTALCIRLLSSVLLLLVGQVDFTYSQNADADFPQVVPNTQQFLEYESFIVSCEGLDGLTGWRVMKRIKGLAELCTESAGPCKIKSPYPEFDSGEYWCEMGAKKSNTVNIIVTAGPVILESPVHPVMEGDAVTLRCRKKQMSSNLTAVFYRDGHLMNRSSTGNTTIHSVSRSHEGLYTCTISGAAESPGSWLTVRAAHGDSPPSPDAPPNQAPQLSLVICTVVGGVLVALLLLGLLRYRKHRTTVTGTPTSPPSFQSFTSPQTVSEDMNLTYAVVTQKPRRQHDKDESMLTAVYHTLSLVEA